MVVGLSIRRGGQTKYKKSSVYVGVCFFNTGVPWQTHRALKETAAERKVTPREQNLMLALSHRIPHNTV